MRVLLALLSLATTAIAGPATTRLVWADPAAKLLGAPSPDGRMLSYVDARTGDLAVYEVGGQRSRRLTHNPPGADTFAYFSVFSRDSSRIAYAWFNERGFYELWMVDAVGGEPRQLYSNPEMGFVQPCDFSADGSEILTLFFRADNVSQLALVSTADGSVRVLKTLSWFYPKKISFSPDDRYILYDSLTGRSETARDILLLDAGGATESKLIEHEANDIFPVWTPAGDAVVFASDRGGDMDLWQVAVQDGAAAGEPQRIARSFGLALPLGVTRAGAYYYGLRAGRSDVWTSSVSNGEAGEAQLAGIRRVGRSTAPAWAPDGKRLAYLTQLGTENYGLESRGVVVWAPETRQETLLVPRLAFVSALRWSPDGSRLLASGSDGRGRSGLFGVDPDSGDVEGLVRVIGGKPQGLEGVWLNESTLAYIDADRSKLLRQGVTVRETAELFSADAGTALEGLAADPSGERIAFGVNTEGGGWQVRLAPTTGGDSQRLAGIDRGALSAIDWAGGSIYATDAAGDVWRIDPADGAVRPTLLPGAEGGPRLSPDGRHVAWTTSDRRSEVWVLEDWIKAPEATPAALRSRSDAASETPSGAP